MSGEIKIKETSATLMAGFGLIASIVQLMGYHQFAGGLYAIVQIWVLIRYAKSKK